MDSADAAAAPFVGGWASIRAYFTPATLFLVVNLVIGTIALTSRATQHRRRRREHEHYHYHDDGHGHYHLQEQEQHHHQPAYGDHYYPPPHQQQQQPLYATPPEPAPLARTSSIVDRLRSFDFGLYRFRSGDFPPEYGAAAAAVPTHAHDAFTPVEEETMPAAEQAHYARTRSEPAPATREERMRPPASRAKKPGSEVRKAQVARSPPARVVEAVAGEDDAVDARAEEEFAASFGREREKSPLQEEYNYQEEYVPPVRPRAPTAAPLARTSSIMDRLRSLGGYLAPEQPAAASIPAAAAEKKQAHYDRSRSEPGEKKQEAKPRMAKSTSETKKAAAPSRAEAALAGESVDARAEAFIDSFKQQQARHHRREQEYVPPPPPLARAPSVLERLRSFGLSRFRSGDLGADLPAAAAAATPAGADEKRQAAAAAQYGRSRSEPAREQGKKEPRMRKSSSSVVEEEEEPAAEADHGGVDARADDFINKFRQQLQLQRLNSLLNYKEMLGGGGKQ
ncbi:unnamed protein product [Urochloa decumbens]|uniref:DUF4408 domain-containing protein n=1 Tax=Urochloa decumbens TaxID=240449 RepID=A0ABC8W3B8_9POAL